MSFVQAWRNVDREGEFAIGEENAEELVGFLQDAVKEGIQSSTCGIIIRFYLFLPIPIS